MPPWRTPARQMNPVMRISGGADSYGILRTVLHLQTTKDGVTRKKKYKLRESARQRRPSAQRTAQALPPGGLAVSRSWRRAKMRTKCAGPGRGPGEREKTGGAASYEHFRARPAHLSRQGERALSALLLNLCFALLVGCKLKNSCPQLKATTFSRRTPQEQSSPTPLVMTDLEGPTFDGELLNQGTFGAYHLSRLVSHLVSAISALAIDIASTRQPRLPRATSQP